jgi:hypothetical protein
VKSSAARSFVVVPVALAIALFGSVTPFTAIAIALGAVTAFVAASYPAWLATRRPAHLAAIALAGQGVLLLSAAYARDLTDLGADVLITVYLALGLAAVAALTAVACELRAPAAFAGAFAWLVGWMGNAAIGLWFLDWQITGHFADAPSGALTTSLVGSLGGTVIALRIARSLPPSERRDTPLRCLGYFVASLYGAMDELAHGTTIRSTVAGAISLLILAAIVKRWHTPPSPVPRAIISSDDSR